MKKILLMCLCLFFLGCGGGKESVSIGYKIEIWDGMYFRNIEGEMKTKKGELFYIISSSNLGSSSVYITDSEFFGNREKIYEGGKDVKVGYFNYWIEK